MRILTKEDLVKALREIRSKGWIPNARPGNVGGVGNTLEDLLGIEENNLPLPNAGEWELKCQRINTTSLTTLFHMEPSPRAIKFVPKVLLPLYGWQHKEANTKYNEDEMSFRQTINAVSRTDRGFGLIVNNTELKVTVSFDSGQVDQRHQQWLKSVESRVGLAELDPQPYWGFSDLFHKAGSKLTNCFFVQAEVKREGKKEYFHFTQIEQLENLSLKQFLGSIEKGIILIDFDARTGHNHGTKIRMRNECLPKLYERVISI